MPKYFVTPDAVTENSIVIEGEDAKHIGTVLRARVGEKLTVCDGYNRDYECTIEEIEKNNPFPTKTTKKRKEEKGKSKNKKRKSKKRKKRR